jgi:CRISPR-associated protein Cas5d
LSTVRLHVRGDFALFTRPEMKVERVSYDVMTPSAARGVLEAIHWKPQITWVVERIHVLRPIRFTNLRRNEVDSKVPVRGAAGAAKAMKDGRGSLGLYVEEARQQRASTLLRDVEYVVEARVELRDEAETVQKHVEMFERRARKGQCFHHPYLGCREFPADFELWEGDEPPPCPESLRGERDLGWILHDLDYADGMAPRFFRATLVDGVLDVPAFDSAEVRR